MSLSINPYGLNLASSKGANLFGTNEKHTSKLIVNGKSIDIKPKEELLPPYLQEIRKKNEEMNYSSTMLKVKNGDDLSAAELAEIREKDPDLYRELMQEIRFQKQFEEQLKNCKNKDEAQTAYLNAQLTVAKMCGATSAGASIPQDQQEKYNRMINRISKSFQKYMAGNLNTSATEGPQMATQSIKEMLSTTNEDPNNVKKQKSKNKSIDDYLPGDIYDSQV